MDDNIDYYELLGVQITAIDTDIKKAYRKKALAVHPDKNPSPDAAVLFHKLTQGYETLLDPKRRATYDNIYRARLEQKKKKQEMDSKRRKAQEELEEQEQKAKKVKQEQDQLKAQHAAELARRREQRERERQEEEELRKRKEEEEKVPETKEVDYALKFKWKKKKHPFTTEDLIALLQPLGATDVELLAEKKKCRALVVFNSVVNAHAVMTSKYTNPALSSFETIEWASGQEPAIITKMNRDEEKRKELRAMLSTDSRSSMTSSPGKPLFKTNHSSSSSIFKNIKIPPPMANFSNAPNLSHQDYETITLMKLRQAECNKKQAKDDSSINK